MCVARFWKAVMPCLYNAELRLLIESTTAKIKTRLQHNMFFESIHQFDYSSSFHSDFHGIAVGWLIIPRG